MMLDQLNRLFGLSVRYLIRRNQSKTPIGGLPDGIRFEVLNDLCSAYLGEPLKRVSHVHISSWKAAGSYRLFLTAAKGSCWSLIYKNAVYHLDQIPALKSLPVNPGPPEYWVYNNTQGVLAEYLPTVYLCSKVIPSKHYQYLLEDVSKNYQKVNQAETILAAAAALPRIHQAMFGWSYLQDQEDLLRYDYEFSMALQEYAIKNLERYRQKTADTNVSELLESWPRISKIHGCKDFYEMQALCPIHGDFNTANILMHRRHPEQIKLVDWEWAGLGIAHSDLASLLKGTTREIEELALAIFTKENKLLSLEEHRRLYRWCQMERGLLDAAFLAAQQLGSPNEMAGINVPIMLEKLMQKVFHAYWDLVSMQPKLHMASESVAEITNVSVEHP